MGTSLTGWLTCPRAHDGLLTLANALVALDIPHTLDVPGYRAVRVGSINSAQRDALLEMLRGLHAVEGRPVPHITGWLPESTPEAREWQDAAVMRALVKEFTSGECYTTRNPYTRRCVTMAACALAAMSGDIPEPAIGVPLADIPLWREA